jgi:hypothetical protein
MAGNSGFEVSEGTLGDLRMDEKNARRHNEKNMSVITDSLYEVGAARSIVIDENNEVMAGNGVTEGASIVGIDDVVIIDVPGDKLVAVRRSGLSEEQKKMLKLYDNRATDLSDFDPQMMAQILVEDPEVAKSLRLLDREVGAIMAKANYDIGEGYEQEEPELQSEHMVEIRCTGEMLEMMQPTLNEWDAIDGIDVFVS